MMSVPMTSCHHGCQVGFEVVVLSCTVGASFEVCFLLEVGSESRVRPRAESCCAGGSD